MDGVLVMDFLTPEILLGGGNTTLALYVMYQNHRRLARIERFLWPEVFGD